MGDNSPIQVNNVNQQYTQPDTDNSNLFLLNIVTDIFDESAKIREENIALRELVIERTRLLNERTVSLNERYELNEYCACQRLILVIIRIAKGIFSFQCPCNQNSVWHSNLLDHKDHWLFKPLLKM